MWVLQNILYLFINYLVIRVSLSSSNARMNTELGRLIVTSGSVVIVLIVFLVCLRYLSETFGNAFFYKNQLQIISLFGICIQYCKRRFTNRQL